MPPTHHGLTSADVRPPEVPDAIDITVDSVMLDQCHRDDIRLPELRDAEGRDGATDNDRDIPMLPSTRDRC